MIQSLLISCQSTHSVLISTLPKPSQFAQSENDDSVECEDKTINLPCGNAQLIFTVLYTSDTSSFEAGTFLEAFRHLMLRIYNIKSVQDVKPNFFRIQSAMSQLLAFGVPFITSFDMIKAYAPPRASLIALDKISLPTAQMTSSKPSSFDTILPWRTTQDVNLTASQSVYITILTKLSAIISPQNSTIVHASRITKIQTETDLTYSKSPNLRIILSNLKPNDKPCLHQAVRLPVWFGSKEISLVPPRELSTLATFSKSIEEPNDNIRAVIGLSLDYEVTKVDKSSHTLNLSVSPAVALNSVVLQFRLNSVPSSIIIRNNLLDSDGSEELSSWVYSASTKLLTWSISSLSPARTPPKLTAIIHGWFAKSIMIHYNFDQPITERISLRSVHVDTPPSWTGSLQKAVRHKDQASIEFRL